MSTPDFTNDERFDGLFLNVAQTTRGIEPLLDTVFSFLRRKTDFFSGPHGQGVDVAVSKVNEVLQKHVAIFIEAEKKRKLLDEEKRRKGPNQMKQEHITTSDATREEGIIELDTDGFDISAGSQSIDVSKKSKQQKSVKENVTEVFDRVDADVPSNDQEDEDTPPLGNGGTVAGKYVWTQTLSEVNIVVDLPKITKASDMDVKIGKKYLKIGLKSLSPKFILDAPLTKPIICDESLWTIEDGKRLMISLQKLHGMEWWDSVCEGDPKIDVKKVQPENSKLADLDGETRQTVEKMMFDQRQKAMGLPTSEERSKLEMLEKFKKAHPELDFSNAKIC